MRKALFAAIAAGVIGTLRVPAAGAGATPGHGHGQGHAYGRVFCPTVRAARARRANQAVAQAAANLIYGGGIDGIGVTTGPPKIYLVFRGSQWGTANPAGSLTLSGDSVGMAPRGRHQQRTVVGRCVETESLASATIATHDGGARG